MGFKCGIVGLPNVGKSTLFNALTETAAAAAANYPFCTIEPNVGLVPVPDPRLDDIARIAKSEKIYAAWGWWAVVVARFMPWARVFVPVIAGVAHMNYYKFFSANAVGALAWGTGLTVTGYFAASIPAVKNASYAIAGFFILASVVAGLRAWLKNRKTA